MCTKIGKLDDPQAQADARTALIASLEKQNDQETGLGQVLPGLLKALKEGSQEDIKKYGLEIKSYAKEQDKEERDYINPLDIQTL